MTEPHRQLLASRRGVSLTEEQRLDWLRLIRSDNVGPVAFRQLINRFGSARNALDRMPELVRRGGARREVRIASVETAEREMERSRRHGARFVALGEPAYPAALAAADAPPPLLAVRGDTDCLMRPMLGVVGSRNASMAGIKLTGMITARVGAADYVVASGLARGIDAAAHRAALRTGTVACYAGGLDCPFPPENVPLAVEIVEHGGVLVSEMPFGWKPRARDFPRRNRLIAGLSFGTLVVEAAQRSGSLITARLANEMGRLVFAVPGSPLDPRAAGTNGLIRQGAILTTSASDIIDALEPLTSAPPPELTLDFEESEAGFDAEPATGERERIVEALGPTPVETDELIAHLGLPAGQVATVLLELELAGRLERHAGGHVSLVAVDA